SGCIRLARQILPGDILRRDAACAAPDDGVAVRGADAVAAPDHRAGPRLRIGPHRVAAPDHRVAPGDLTAPDHGRGPGRLVHRHGAAPADRAAPDDVLVPGEVLAADSRPQPRRTGEPAGP